MKTEGFQSQFPLSYELVKRGAEPNRLLIALHGYRQDHRFFLDQLEQLHCENSWILLPNAPLPIPEFKGKEIALGYAWYLFDPKNQAFVFDMSLSLDLLRQLVSKIGLCHYPITIIGYSQGGYLAPYLGRLLPNTRQVIGIHSRFRDEDFPEPLHFRLDAIHGSLDQMVDPVRSASCHERLLDKGNQGSFYLIPETGHQMTGAVRETLNEILKL